MPILSICGYLVIIAKFSITAAHCYALPYEIIQSSTTTLYDEKNSFSTFSGIILENSVKQCVGLRLSYKYFKNPLIGHDNTTIAYPTLKVGNVIPYKGVLYKVIDLRKGRTDNDRPCDELVLAKVDIANSLKLEIPANRSLILPLIDDADSSHISTINTVGIYAKSGKNSTATRRFDIYYLMPLYHGDFYIRDQSYTANSTVSIGEYLSIGEYFYKVINIVQANPATNAVGWIECDMRPAERDQLIDRIVPFRMPSMSIVPEDKLLGIRRRRGGDTIDRRYGFAISMSRDGVPQASFGMNPIVAYSQNMSKKTNIQINCPYLREGYLFPYQNYMYRVKQIRFDATRPRDNYIDFEFVATTDYPPGVHYGIGSIIVPFTSVEDVGSLNINGFTVYFESTTNDNHDQGLIAKLKILQSGSNIVKYAEVKIADVLALGQYGYSVRAIIKRNTTHNVAGWVELSPDYVKIDDLSLRNNLVIQPK